MPAVSASGMIWLVRFSVALRTSTPMEDHSRSTSAASSSFPRSRANSVSAVSACARSLRISCLSFSSRRSADFDGFLFVAPSGRPICRESAAARRTSGTIDRDHGARFGQVHQSRLIHP